MEKNIAPASLYLQKLKSRMLKYYIDVKYIKGKTNVVANA